MINKTKLTELTALSRFRLALLPLDIKIWMVTALIWIVSIGTVFLIFDIFDVSRWRALEWEKFLTILLLPATVSGLAIAGYRWAIRTSDSGIRSRIEADYQALRLAKQNRKALKNASRKEARRNAAGSAISVPAQLRQAFESNDASPEMQENIEGYVEDFARELSNSMMKENGDVLRDMVHRNSDEFSRHGAVYANPRKAFDDFIHAYLAAPEHAERAAPRFFGEFENFLKTDAPHLLKTFHDTAELYRRYANLVLSKSSALELEKELDGQRKHRRMPASLLDFGDARIAP